MPKELKEIKEPTKEIVKFDITTAEITEMSSQYMKLTIKSIADKKGFGIVHDARMDVKGKRVAVEKQRVKYKAKILEVGREIDSDANTIFTLLEPIESHLQREEQAISDEKARVAAEKDRLEEERVEDIRAKIHKIQESVMPTVLGTMALENLRELSSRLEDMEIKETEYMEFTKQAEETLDNAYNACQDAITARIKLDKEAKDRQLEDARLEKVRLDQEAARKLINEAAARHQAKIDKDNLKIRLAQKKIDDDKAELAAEKQADADRKAKEEFEKEATKKAEAEAAQKVLDDNREKEEKKKADEVEKERKEKLKPDRSKMEDFANYLQENIPYPELQLDEFRDLLKSVRTQIYDIGNEILEALEG